MQPYNRCNVYRYVACACMPIKPRRHTRCRLSFSCVVINAREVSGVLRHPTNSDQASKTSLARMLGCVFAQCTGYSDVPKCTDVISSFHAKNCSVWRASCPMCPALLSLALRLPAMVPSENIWGRRTCVPALELFCASLCHA